MIPKQYLMQYERLLAKSIKASQTFRAYKAKLALTCDHPDAYVEDWKWEHDNGYGRQNWNIGKQCTICHATKSYTSDTRWCRDGRVV